MSKVYIAGAGPGDLGLVTKKCFDLIASADAILYDKLANPLLLINAKPTAKLIFVGKESGNHFVTQDDTIKIMISLAKQGLNVLRLKGGDPFIFGRGSEEAEALVDANIQFDIIPGVTAASGATAYAGIPLTHRNLTNNCIFVTAHESDNENMVDWENLAKVKRSTIVVYMGVKRMAEVAKKLIAFGKDPSSLIAVISNGTLPNQLSYSGQLSEIESIISNNQIKPPSLFVISPTVELSNKIHWFGNSALSGKRIVTTRSQQQASSIYDLLIAQGAEVIPIKSIRTELVTPEVKLSDQLRLGKYDWVFFTSENAVRYFFELLSYEKIDARAFGSSKIAVVGTNTALKLSEYGLIADFTPSIFTSDNLLIEFKEKFDLENLKILRIKGNFENDSLTTALHNNGAFIDTLEVYATIQDAPNPELIDDIIKKGADAFTFTSASTVNSTFNLLGNNAKDVLNHSLCIAIGPVTAKALYDKDIANVVISEIHTVQGIIDTLITHFESKTNINVVDKE